MGHTDSTGSDSYNLDLSRRRAEAVAELPGDRAASRARASRTIGYGEQYPRADNTTEQGRALNRRVEIRIMPISQEEVSAAAALIRQLLRSGAGRPVPQGPASFRQGLAA